MVQKYLYCTETIGLKITKKTVLVNNHVIIILQVRETSEIDKIEIFNKNERANL